VRKLIYHPESDCYFEIFDEKEYQESMSDGFCVDVTGEKDHEERFKVTEGVK